jgi:hypothetical protein
MDDAERALLAILDSEADQEVPAGARCAAQRDVAAIRRGMTLLASDAAPASTAPAPAGPAPRGHRRHRRLLDRRWLAVAAGVAVLAVALAVVPGLIRKDSPGTSTVPAPTLSLGQQAARAQRIVVGTVTKVDYGRLGGQVEGETGDRYVLATVRVEEAIKGPDGQVVAFSYDFGAAGSTSEGSSRPWRVGDHILLFLVPDAGSVSAGVSPPHLQVAGGETGRYFIHGDRLDNAQFTLDDVRRAAR